MRWENLTDKAKYRRVLHIVQRLKTWQLVILLLLGLIVSSTLLRLNNLNMVERRTAVIAADEKGDSDAIRASVVELQRYISRHMNTNLEGGFFLTKTYERDRDAALAAASQTTNPNSTVYQQASVECRSRFQGGRESFRNDYVQCVIEKVSSLTAQSDVEQDLKLPKADAYKISFSSPIWTPDLAGLAVAFCVLVSLVIIGRMALVLILRWLLRRHYRSI
jgi:hypothetical protein